MGRSALRSRGLFCVSILSLVLVCIAHGAAEGALLKVPGDASTIQGAIDLASSGDTVAVAGATYKEHLVVGKDLVLLGGWNASFTSRDPVAHETVVDGQDNAPQVVRFAEGLGKSTMLDGFTITDGLAPQSTGFLGGAIYCRNCSPVISNNIIRGSRANFGAGIVCLAGAEPDIIGNEILENVEIQTSGLAGCGIFCRDSSPNISDNYIHNNKGSGIRCERSAPLIENNEIASNTHGAGVACLEGSNANVRGNLIRANRARYGGGVWIEDSTPMIQYNMIRDNEIEVVSALGGGAGLAAFGDTGSPIISHNTFLENKTTTDGGAILVMGSSMPTIQQNLFKENSTYAGGGAIVVQGYAAATIRNNTFYRNRSQRGGAILARQNASAFLTRNIIFGSATGGGVWVDAPAYVSLVCNCVSNNLPSGYVGWSPGATDIQLNPIFCRTDGDTLDLALNSPCLPENNSCGLLIGAFGEGTCGSFPTNLSLIEPIDGAVLNDDTPIFRWGGSKDPDGGSIYYEFEYGTDPTFETSTVVDTGSDTLYALQSIEALSEGLTFYWHATAIDEQNNTTTSDQIWKLKIDMTAPKVTLGVHQHPYLDSHLDFYAVVDEDITGDVDASLNLNGSPHDLEMELIDPDEMLFYAPFEIAASGTAILNVDAADLAGNFSAKADTFSLEVVRPGAGASFSSPDGGLTVSVRDGAFPGTSYFLVKNAGESFDPTGAPASEFTYRPQAGTGSDGEDTQGRQSRVYSVTWSPSGPAFPVKLAFPGGAVLADDVACVCRWTGQAWESLPTYRDPQTRELFTLTSRPGLFQLRTTAGPGQAHVTALFQNFPNPFRGNTTMAFTVGGAGGGTRGVSVKIVDVKGRLVKSLLDAELEPGPYAVTWDGTNFNGAACPSGLYLCVLNIEDGGTTARKMILMR